MVSNISYRLITFADYSNIRFDNETVSLLKSEFNEEQYNFNQIFDLNGTGQINLGFTLVPEINSSIPNISIFPGKLDIRVGSNRKEGFNSDEQKKSGEILCSFFNRLSNCFGGRLQDPNRLALITEYVYFEIGIEKRKAFRDKFIRVPKYYENKKTDEVVVKIFGRDKIDINNKDEDINIITNVDRWFPGSGIGMTASVDGYRVEFDLNTSPENKKNRFTEESLPVFVEKMQDIKALLSKEIFDDCE